MTKQKAATIVEMHTLGICAVDSYSYMFNEEKLGHILKDRYNYVKKLKIKAIESGVAQVVITILH